MIRKLIFILVLLSSCKKEEIVEAPIIYAGLENNILVCNEGNFNWGNSSVSLYNPNNKSTVDCVFYKINNVGLGDVCQSAVNFNGKIYIVVNNSAKIEVLDENNFESITTITGFTSPRYFLPVSITKAYVTDLYSNKIWVVDLSSKSISGSIKCNGWTEELVKRDGNVYVTNMESAYVYVLDSDQDIITDSINIGTGVGSAQLDNANNIWLLRSETPTLFKLKENHSLEQFDIINGSNPGKLRYNPIDDALYFINGGIDKFDIGNENFQYDYITNFDRTYYGLGVDPTNGDIYVSDAKDFVQRSTVYIYSQEAEPKRNFDAGINSGYFLFGN